MSSIKAFQDSSEAAALAIMEKAVETLQSLQTAYQQHFPPQLLSAVQKAIADRGDLTQNDALDATLATTLDAADTVLNHLTLMEQYINLMIPKMEDGNNFGVTVQLSALKAVQDFKEKLEKGLDDLTKYASQRAEALEKCKLPSKTTTTSTTSSESAAETKGGEKGDLNTSEKKTSTEEKMTQSSTEAPELEYRNKAVTAVDLAYYIKAKSVFQNALTAYMTAVDFMEKNKEKISQPKGSRGSGTVYSSMY